MKKADTDRYKLIDIFAQVYGFKLPLREFQRMAIEQIDHERLDAILEAGWSPSNMTMKYESSQAALTDVLTEHRVLVERLEALADQWKSHGFGEQSGSKYAADLLAAVEQDARS